MSPKIIGLILVVVAMVALYITVFLAVTRTKQRARAMRALYTPEEVGVSEDNKLSGYAEFCAEVLSALGLKVNDLRTKLYNQLGHAGLQSDESAYKFFFFRYIVQNIILFVGLIVLFTIISGGNVTSINAFIKLLFAAMLVYFGILGHEKVLSHFARRRKESFVTEFPDTVDLLLICVESGMGLDAALTRVSKELRRSHPTMASELARTKLELGIYGDRVQALQNLAERCNIQSVRSLVTALVQTEKYGTNLASTLRTLAADYRTERLLNAETRAAKVGVLLTLPVVIGVFFPVMGLILAPPIIQVLAAGVIGQ